MTQRAGYLFISCPASTTPMHFDVEHSFLLQVRGRKHVSVASFADDPVARHRELDRYIDGEECDFEAMQAKAETPVMGPGVGVYLPSFVPHWVETEAGVSISFSIPSIPHTQSGPRACRRINRRLRQLHLSPRPLGASEPVDKRRRRVPVAAEAARRFVARSSGASAPDAQAAHTADPVETLVPRVERVRVRTHEAGHPVRVDPLHRRLTVLARREEVHPIQHDRLAVAA